MRKLAPYYALERTLTIPGNVFRLETSFLSDLDVLSLLSTGPSVSEDADAYPPPSIAGEERTPDPNVNGMGSNERRRSGAPERASGSALEAGTIHRERKGPRHSKKSHESRQLYLPSAHTLAVWLAMMKSRS